MIQHKNIWLLLCLVMFIFGCQTKSEPQMVANGLPLSLSHNSLYNAGDTIKLDVNDQSDITFRSDLLVLLLNHGMLTTALSAKGSNDDMFFEVPEFVANKSGAVAWTLFYDQKEVEKGNFGIRPAIKKQEIIPAYVGPPSILAGGNDHTMLVVIPTDIYGNTLNDGEALSITKGASEVITKLDAVTTNGLSWSRFYSDNKSGKIKIGVASASATSNELEVVVDPNTPKDFTIFTERYHNYADGNESITLKTAVIVDSYNNTVADGTQVEFIIRTNAEEYLNIKAATVQGVASAYMQHPDSKSRWEIQANIDGMASSAPISIDFETAISVLPVYYDEPNQMIKVGPIIGHLGQRIPDGVRVVLMFNNQELMTTSTKDGLALIKLTAPLSFKDDLQTYVCALGICESLKQEQP
ncbi:MAG: hypothetical protein ABJM06_13175 [Gilvibacter sp.]